jgi:hypothetical protein
LAAGSTEQVNSMLIPLPEPDWTPEEADLAERLGGEARERILSRMLSGTPLLLSVRIEADFIAEAWAHHRSKVQLRAIQIAFDVLHHWNPNEPG